MRVETKEYRVEESELFKTLVRHSASSIRTYFGVAVIVGGGIYLIGVGGAGATAFGVIYVLLGLCLPVILAWVGACRSVAAPIQRHTYRILFDDDTITQSSESGAGAHLPYVDIVKVRLVPEGIMLFIMKTRFLLVPARSFDSLEQMREVYAWVNDRRSG